jgi:Ca-activated chloride channel family protein
MKYRIILLTITMIAMLIVACSTARDQSANQEKPHSAIESSTTKSSVVKSSGVEFVDSSTTGDSTTSPAKPLTAATAKQHRQNGATDVAAATQTATPVQPNVQPKAQTNAKTEAEVGSRDASRQVLANKIPSPPAEEKVLHDKARLSVAARAIAAAPASSMVPLQWRAPSEPVNRENYAHFDNNPVMRVAENPVSTFSIDVDTGSYTNVRRMLRQGQLPVHDAVRVEEFINYFNYEYSAPESLEHPFNVITELGPTPWNPSTRLLHIGIKAYEVAKEQLPPNNLVFLVDVSGSMQSPDKLPLLVNSLKLLVNKMRNEDSISLVVYAGASGVVLEPTSGQYKAQITAALDSLTAGGSTNGGAGIRLAYAKAREAFIENGINRVILATDGDFNVGTVNFQALTNLVEEKRKTGINLTTLGFGGGNYNDQLMEQLADKGNGNYAYIDSLNEAQKVLVNEMSSTLQTVAKDVKIQLEFNPTLVAEYRLIGYENRALRREDFNNDKIDAGEIGAGHTVTALYEIALVDSEGNSQGAYMDELRYGKKVVVGDQFTNELALLRLRYKKPAETNSQLIETPVTKTQLIADIAQTSSRYRFAASVAAFGQILRGGHYTQHFALDDVMELARHSRGNDPWGYRSEFLNMVNLAKALQRS